MVANLLERKTWCCPGFRSAYEDAGGRGLGVLIIGDESDDEPRFVFQFRAVRAGSTILWEDPEPISLVSEAMIRFCPWCGRELAKWYSSSWRGLIRPDIPTIELNGDLARI
jgi:hypothetical protein